jgi:hypothetical protein
MRTVEKTFNGARIEVEEVYFEWHFFDFVIDGYHTQNHQQVACILLVSY